MKLPFKTTTKTIVKLFLFLLLIVATTFPTVATTQAQDDSGDYKVVGYFTQWGMYARNYRVKNIVANGSADKLTHINYAFANVSTESRCYEETRLGWGDAAADHMVSYTAGESVDGVGDDISQPIKGHWNQLRKLKIMYPKLKVLISIGGWSWSGRFSDAAKPENRVEFVKSCIDLFIKGNLPMWAKIDKDTPAIGRDNTRAEGVFDGIDIDWEYPASPAFEGDPKRELPPNVYRPEDTQNFTALLAEFRKQLDEIGKENGKHYLLTIAVPAGESLYSKIELDKAGDIVDFMNLMAYDMHGTGGDAAGPTNFQAPLYTSPDDPSEEPISVDSAVQGYLKAGVPPQKIVLGVPFYGHGWTNVPEKDNGLYQSDPKMVQAPGKWEAGIEDYKILKKLGFPEFRDPKTQSMWIYDGKTWWSYDDPQVIAAKMDYIKKQKLGGTMFWSLDGDDGTLVQAIHDGLSGK